QGAVEVVLREAEPADDRRRTVAPGVSAGMLEPRLRLGVAIQRRLHVVAFRHGLLEAAKLLLERDEVARPGEHVLAQRQLLLERRPLVAPPASPWRTRARHRASRSRWRGSGAASSCRRRWARKARRGRGARRRTRRRRRGRCPRAPCGGWKQSRLP